MNRFIVLALVLLNFNFLISQEVIISEYIEPDSDFLELKKELKNGDTQLAQIETAFMTWNYSLLKPFLYKKIKRNVKSFFKNHRDSILKYQWKKRTHNGPLVSGVLIDNFGFLPEHNELRFHSTNKNYKVNFIDYYYYVSDSTLTIYSMESRRYLGYNQIKTNFPEVTKTKKIASSLSDAIKEKKTTAINDQLLKLEELEPKLLKLEIFNHKVFKTQLARNYGNLSWYLIFDKKYNKAIIAAKKGLFWDKNQTWIYTNLALSNLLAGNKNNALKIYRKYKTENTNNNQNFKRAFISDLNEAKNAQLINESLYKEIVDVLNE